ncbi:zf-TFIIB domain-containing protein [uncultured Paenibacillus sp.]|uniref:TFIIB-type zinc ribbon-containing protein n=1 Tax=uncultured Paenibacillus sp. TaxID=227322 RepID=UPI0037DDA5A4
MKCPVCDDVRMREVEKDGVTVDVCPDCKGVWLDRGELEKLMLGVRDMRKELEEREEELLARQPDTAFGSDPSGAGGTRAAPPVHQYPPAQPGAGSGHTPYGTPPQTPGGQYGTGYGNPGCEQPVYGHGGHGQHGYGGHGGHGYGMKHGYDKYGRPYKKKKTVLDVFGNLFD